MSSAARSSIGARDENQDRQGAARAGEHRCWVVADGLGGHAGGARAAELVVDEILAGFAAEPGLDAASLRSWLERAQAALEQLGRDKPALVDARSTVVVLVEAAGRARWAHVGDTRLYLFRDGRVLRQTLDHSVPQALVEAGRLEPEGIRTHPDRNRVLRSLGGTGPVRPTVLEEDLAIQSGDAFLLCSDGLWELVSEAEMEQARTGSADAEGWLDGLDALVGPRQDASADNCTATAVCFGPDASRSRRLASRARRAAFALALVLGLGALAWLLLGRASAGTLDTPMGQAPYASASGREGAPVPSEQAATVRSGRTARETRP